MADVEHIKWLREGVQKWNERRMREDFEPDLEEADIARFNEREIDRSIPIPDDFVDLSGINLSHAKLRSAELYSVDFTKANLRGADLTNSHLNGAVFEDANLDYADLRGASTCAYARFKEAKLVCAKLSDADFSGTDFRNAVLAEATLDRTNLLYAWLSGANLSRTQLWKAVLFSGDPRPPPQLPLRSENICKVADLLAACRDIRGRYNNEDVRFYFRGESCTNWELRPSVQRDERFRIAEAEMLTDLMSRRSEDFDNLNSCIAQLVLAQHHGLSTRLLDITRNPLVALFHACNGCKSESSPGRLHVFAVNRALVKPFNSDSISIIANFAKLCFEDQEILLTKRSKFGDIQAAVEYPKAMDRLYQLIHQEKPYFKERIDPTSLFRVFVVEPQQSFERIRAQSGAFLISAFHGRFEPHEVLKWNNGIPIYDHFALEVPHRYKENVVEELRLLNISSETLFPGLGKAAGAVMNRVKNRPDNLPMESQVDPNQKT
ncbi:MAG: pentapeptide repeat-containing protein [Gemmatimonadota bacterium]|nr:pentapeptide repeat-containing protein [Gemmatimonadota bacterium]